MSPKPIPVEKVTSFPLNNPPAKVPNPSIGTTIPGPVPSSPKHDPDVHVRVPDPKDPKNYPSPG